MQITQNFRFLAPELFAPQVVDGLGDPDRVRSNQATDVYALGMTFLELGTLQYPFCQIASPHTAAEMALKGQRPARPDLLGGFMGKDGDWIWDLITSMWGQEPDSRPGLDKLQEVLQQSATQIPELKANAQSSAGVFFCYPQPYRVLIPKSQCTLEQM